MTIAQQLIDIATAKEATRLAIVAKGGTLPAGSGLTDFPAAVEGIECGSGGGEPCPEPDGWMPPGDWPDIRTGLAENSWTGLAELEPDDDMNWAAFSVTAVGGYTVDWGDGSTPTTHPSGETAEHQWTWADSGPTLADGTRVVVVRVTAVGPITGIDYVKLPTAMYEHEGRLMPWLDLALDVPAMTSFNIRSNMDVTRPHRLKQLSIYQMAITNAAYMFYGCSSLTRLPDVLDTSKVTNAYYMFRDCASLTRLPDVLDMSNVTNAINMFYGCSSLTRLPDILDIKTSFSVSSAALGRTALDAMFTALPTVSGQTVTITNTPGRSTCDRSIATNKGWTVTG